MAFSAGAGPVTQNGCSVQAGSETTGIVTQLESGDPQHLLFAVRLVPFSPRDRDIWSLVTGWGLI